MLNLPLVVAGALTATAVVAVVATSSGPENPKELGRVVWLRDYDQAISQAKQTGTPVFLLFQEVPGCQTCVTFGEEPLSHPLIVESIETEFVPLAIHNSKPGRDDEIRVKFNEPAWNYPVARFINADGIDVIPRRDEIWETNGLVNRMIAALNAAGREVPAYLEVVAAESDLKKLERATFAMHCYWNGEVQLGALDGVVRTNAGVMGGQETVDVTFDPGIISYAQLVEAAQRQHCASTVYAHNEEQRAAAEQVIGENVRPAVPPSRTVADSDQKYHLKQHSLRFLPLTPMQATKVNSAVRLETDPAKWLSPRQLALLKDINAALSADPDALDDLMTPDSVALLSAYEQLLRKRLAKFQ